MNKWYVILFLIGIGRVSFAGEVEIGLEAFKTVEIIGNYTVKLVQSDKHQLVIDNKDGKVDDNEILASVFDGQLKIQIQRDTYTKRNITMTLYYQSIEGITAKRGAEVEAGSITGESLSLLVNSGGKIKVDAKVTNADLAIRSGGSIKITGAAEKANFSVQTGGLIGASFFAVQYATADVQMGGEIILNATEALTANVKAGGRISYKGAPKKVNKNIKLGGSITPL